MAIFTGSPLPSPFPSMNELLAPRELALASARQADYHQNALMQQQQSQRAIGAADMEMGSRIAATLVATGDEAKAAEMYPGLIAEAQRNGYLRNAPPVFPGMERARALAAMGTSSEKLGDRATNKAGWDQILGGGAPGSGAGGPAGGGSNTRPEASGAPPAAGTPGAAVAQRTHDFWTGQGFNEEQTAGILAGGPGSESDFTPSVLGDNATSYGLYQHHGPRWAGMQQRYGTKNPTEAQQNEYAAWEISPAGPLARVGEQLKNAKTAEEAATIWTRDFGVPGDKTEIPRRARGARRYVGIYGGQQQASTPPGVQMGGEPPPPPGGGQGAPGGAYTDGGFGAAIAPATAAAKPPGQAAADIIEGGIRQAQAAPLVPGTGLEAGPSGAVAATAEPGWGTTLGNYGTSPGTPPVAPTPPPPVSAPSAAPPRPAPAGGLLSGLTPEQTTALRALGATNASPAEGLKLIQHFREQNAATAHQAMEDQRQQRRDALAEETATQKAKEADRPFQSKGDDADLRNYLVDPNHDPKSPVYHAAYSAYADTKDVNGLIIKRNMGAFRMPQDADGNPVTTYDQSHMAIGPGDLTKMRQIETESGTLISALDDFVKTAKNASLGERLATVAGASTDLGSAWTNLALMAKGEGLFVLGVLSGPDMRVLRGVFADPSTFMGSLASTDTIEKQANRARTLLQTRLEQAHIAYGRGVSGTVPAAKAAEPTAAAPAASGGWSVKRLD